MIGKSKSKNDSLALRIAPGLKPDSEIKPRAEKQQTRSHKPQFKEIARPQAALEQRLFDGKRNIKKQKKMRLDALIIFLIE